MWITMEYIFLETFFAHVHKTKFFQKNQQNCFEDIVAFGLFQKVLWTCPQKQKHYYLFMHVTHGFYYYFKNLYQSILTRPSFFCMKILLIFLKKMADNDHSHSSPPHDDTEYSDGSSSSKKTENTLRCLVYTIQFTIF